MGGAIEEGMPVIRWTGNDIGGAEIHGMYK
jgi:hypothetical protein